MTEGGDNVPPAQEREPFLQRSAVRLATFTSIIRLFALLRALDGGAPLTGSVLATGEDLAVLWAGAFGITAMSPRYR